MIPTFFSTLALGTITNTVASIIALATWISGSAILQGNLFFDTTNNTTPKTYVNTVVVQEYTQSGVTLLSGGLERGRVTYGNCTATGGLTTYSTCIVNHPFSTSGSLLAVGLECSETGVAAQLTGDVSFKLTATSSSGAPLTNLDAIVAGTGSLEVSQFATEVVWNPAEILTYTTLVTPDTVNCKLFATVDEKF